MMKILFILFLLIQSTNFIFAQEDETLISRLLTSASANDVEGIAMALENGESIDSTNVNGWSAAMFAVGNYNLGVVRYLIDQGIDLNIQNSEGITPLMLAASQSDKEMVEMLIAGNANPLIAAVDGSTAYTNAVSTGRKVVAMLIAEACVIHAIDNEDTTSLIYYIREGAFVNLRNGTGMTPLMFVTSRGDIEAVKILLTFGPDVNRTNDDGNTALHFAAEIGNEEIVKLLLIADANAGMVNGEGKTAKMIATENGFASVAAIIPDVVETEL